jgi:hypothetical protein
MFCSLNINIAQTHKCQYHRYCQSPIKLNVYVLCYARWTQALHEVKRNEYHKNSNIKTLTSNTSFAKNYMNIMGIVNILISFHAYVICYVDSS